ncbi:hypothetical protein BJ742DRAFT_766775 [Cladochytrium replicatum]|nr:hypothetical protein BJ742DRAFT_766775 [Cladochytrium replicatum]
MCDATVWCGTFFNHVTLVNNVYPTEPGAEGPQSSNISLLIFYAKTKSNKLPKIGAYLEKRALTDLRKDKFVFIKVTLNILDTLINECHENLNLVSKPILRILLSVVNLGQSNPDLVLQATSTFVTFSQYYVHDLVIDPELQQIYTSSVEEFCGCAVYDSKDVLVTHRLNLSGLRALQATVSSDTFLQDPAVEEYSKLIIPALLETLRKHIGEDIGSQHLSGEDSTSDQLANKRASVTDELITDSELAHVAMAALNQLFCRANPSSLRTLLSPLFAFFYEHDEWSSGKYVMPVMRTVASAIPTQYRYVLTATVLESLTDEESYKKKSEETKHRMINIIMYLIDSGSAVAGLTVLEILDALVKVAIRAAEDGAHQNSKASSESTVEDATVSAIGALAAHLQYPDQINDILSFVLNRMRLGDVLVARALPNSDNSSPTPAPSDQTNGTPEPASAQSGASSSQTSPTDAITHRLRINLLRALSELVDVRSRRIKSPGFKRGSVVRTPVNYELLEPLLPYVIDDDLTSRMVAHSFFYRLMLLEMTETGTGVNAQQSARFCRNVHRYLNSYAQRTSNEPIDFMMIGSLMCVFVRRFFHRQLVQSVPFALRLQHIATTGSLSASRSRALVEISSEYFVYAAKYLQLSDLQKYISKVRSKWVSWTQDEESSGEGAPTEKSGASVKPAVWGMFGALGGDGPELNFGLLRRMEALKFKEIEHLDNGASSPVGYFLLNKDELISSILKDPTVQLLDSAQLAVMSKEYSPETEVDEAASSPPVTQLYRRKSANKAVAISSNAGPMPTSVAVQNFKKLAPSIKTSSQAILFHLTKSDAPAALSVRVDELKEALATAITSSDPSSPVLNHWASHEAIGQQASTEVTSLLNSITNTVESRKFQSMTFPQAGGIQNQPGREPGMTAPMSIPRLSIGVPNERRLSYGGGVLPSSSPSSNGGAGASLLNQAKGLKPGLKPSVSQSSLRSNTGSVRLKEPSLRT